MHPPKNRLWAPWRLQYIKNAHKEKGCFLCRYTSQRKDRRNLVVGRTKHSLSVINRFPYNNGHLLIAPKRHIPDMESLSQDEILDLWGLMTDMKGRLEETMHPQGYNIGLNLGRSAGAGLPGHLHLHIVPRWTGDTNFMPVLGRTKILPMALEDLYRLLVRRSPVRSKKKKRSRRRRD